MRSSSLALVTGAMLIGLLLVFPGGNTRGQAARAEKQPPSRYNPNEEKAACEERGPNKEPTGRQIPNDSQCGTPIAKLLSGTVKLTLSRARDYRHVGGNVDCPNCKDLECAAFAPPDPKGRIGQTALLASRNAGHWYRCGVEALCGRAEFSDPAAPQQDCTNKASCWICRATDDGRNAEDDIQFTWQ
jgi:hypothetical protein